MKKNKGNAIVASSSKEREESISNGTWMPRGHLMPTGKQLENKRENLKKELRKLCDDY